MNPNNMYLTVARFLPAGILAMLVGASMGGGAYHIDYDQWGGNPADEWIVGGGLVNLCESQGLTDKINANPTPNRGVGGLCFASSQDFADCTFDFEDDPLGGKPIAVDGNCTTRKTAADGEPNEKGKKPFQNETHADWGFIEPKCMLDDGTNKTMNCPSTKSAEGVGLNWFIRINSNSRSCSGAWGQTFAYKESIAYWGGTAPNPNTGVSGHVTFFVDDIDPTLMGTYDRKKENRTTNPISDIADIVKTAVNCTGNGESWGLLEGRIGKP